MNWKAVNKLGDYLISNLNSGYNPPEELKYLNYEWNKTLTFNRWRNLYRTHGSKFLTELFTTPIF